MTRMTSTFSRTGSTLVSPAVPDRASRRTDLAFTGLFQKRSGRISVPVKCFLVESGGRKILVDTGWGKKCVRHPLAAVGFGMWFASEPVLTEDETLERWLSRLGIAPGSSTPSSSPIWTWTTSAGCGMWRTPGISTPPPRSWRRPIPGICGITGGCGGA
jgi:hypothetical protein